MTYHLPADPEANLLYRKYSDVDASFWEALATSDPEEISRRTGAVFSGSAYQLPFLNQLLVLNPFHRQLSRVGAEGREPGFQLCLVSLLFLLRVNSAALAGSQVSPREFKGGTTFFQGPHALPVASLEARYGQDLSGFLKAGSGLGGQPQALGDAALILPVFPGLKVGVILWEADAEFPAQVSFTVPAGLETFWPLDAVWALLNVVAQELLQAGTLSYET